MSSGPAICKAGPADVAALKIIAKEAYQLYVPRIGHKPAPMVADFERHVRRQEVFILTDTLTDTLADRKDPGGYIVTFARAVDQFIENVAVLPDRQGHGYGYILMQFAEALARENNLNKLVLYTNVKMTENLDFYNHLRYVETERITEDGFERIYFEKRLLPC